MTTTISDTRFPLERFARLQTPFYYYDTALLQATLDAIAEQLAPHPDYHLHYAVKANANPEILRRVARSGFGADCVSGGEIQAALSAGIPADKIVFAGVGKTDSEINLALDHHIHSFNVESLPELQVISDLAQAKGLTANVALRINPDVDPHTHAKITTGLAENKFGLALADTLPAIRLANELPGVNYLGLHFHIGSQILDLSVFDLLCDRINALQEQLEAQGITTTRTINVGGGLGVDYTDPAGHPLPPFADYFERFAARLRLRPGQQLHFELGRSVVAQCGTLIARTLYVKQGATKQFLILDAGFTDLIRPAMYGAHHHILNLSAPTGAPATATYDVVGPICESSDVFARDAALPLTRRGDLIALRSAGAYGEVMASQYNCRSLPPAYFSEE